MVGSIGTATVSGYQPGRPREVQEAQPDLMPMRRPGEEEKHPVEETRTDEAKTSLKEKEKEFLLRHSTVSLEERMKQVLSERDIKMILYMTAPIPRTDEVMATGSGALFDALG